MLEKRKFSGKSSKDHHRQYIVFNFFFIFPISLQRLREKLRSPTIVLKTFISIQLE